MSPELANGLRARFPLVFKAQPAPRGFATPAVSLDIGDGWHNLLETACELLYGRYTQALSRYSHLREREGLPAYRGTGGAMTAVEVEKARLAAAAEAERVPCAIQVKEKFGSLRFYASEASPTQQAYIDFAEVLSAKTCEVCGEPGTLTGSRWLKATCSRHKA